MHKARQAARSGGDLGDDSAVRRRKVDLGEQPRDEGFGRSGAQASSCVYKLIQDHPIEERCYRLPLDQCKLALSHTTRYGRRATFVDAAVYAVIVVHTDGHGL
jgi:hypothetical protein